MRNQFVLIFFIGLFVVNCGSSKKASQQKRETTTSNSKKTTGASKEKTKKTTSTKTTETSNKKEKKKSTASKRITNQEYIDTYATAAMNEMKKHKIPASITLAQGILESGSGNGRLAKKANNHFGIKCHNWDGKKIYHDDDKKGECFRKYKRAYESYRDHSEFLTSRRRYANLFQLDQYDYKAWARGLKKAGYATDPKYPNKLIHIIEKYNLYEYDEKVLGPQTKKKPNFQKDNFTHTVIKGDTLYGLARRYKTTVEKLKSQNNLTSNVLSIGQELVIPE